MNMGQVKAILFDSGRVLNYPATGHWFMPPGFFDQVDREAFSTLGRKRTARAFRKAEEQIGEWELIRTTEEELACFTEFYRVFARELPELGLGSEQVEALARSLVYDPKKYVFYDDARKVIPKLKENFRLGVVSDAWPSLREVYKAWGMEGYFDSFVISSLLGVTKPDERMYRTALRELGIRPEEAVFVDDNPRNCVGAVKLGLKSVLLCRDPRSYVWNKVTSLGRGYRAIGSLEELAEGR